MTQNQAVAQFAIALPQPNLPQQLGQAKQFTAIPENDRALKLVELKAIARQFDLMTHVVEIGPLNQKASYIKAWEAYRHQHQYEAATASNSECDRFFASDVMDWAQKLNQAFAGVSAIGSRDRRIARANNISFHSSKCCHGQSTTNATFSIELLPRTPNDSSVQAQPRWHSRLIFLPL